MFRYIKDIIIEYSGNYKDNSPMKRKFENNIVYLKQDNVFGEFILVQDEENFYVYEFEDFNDNKVKIELENIKTFLDYEHFLTRVFIRYNKDRENDQFCLQCSCHKFLKEYKCEHIKKFSDEVLKVKNFKETISSASKNM